MNQDEDYMLQMQGGGKKDTEKQLPPPPPPERRKDDAPFSEPEPGYESWEPPPDEIEPEEGWDRE
ncbi:MAG: hypothetical protein P9F75_05655 [Candidatus Contendobacter sp.]|nr:hypothetical protein [Candidatus Contendobacter sp.]